MTEFDSQKQPVNTNHSDQNFLSQALELAKIRLGFCSPNPSVGAVLVNSEGEVIAKGYHLKAGTEHAEVNAINHLANIQLAENATMYITLEPCCHFGKTPPCTELLIKAKVKRVVYGYCDPNPIVAGKGATILQAAGIICDYIPCPQIQEFYTSYNYWLTTKKPFVTAKIAMTLNGKIAGPHGERTQLTGNILQEFTHSHRKKHDAILTTAATIIADNPLLNVRYKNEIFSKPIYVIDRELKTPLSSHIFSTAKYITLFHQKNVNSEKKVLLQQNGARCIAIDTTPTGLMLPSILEHIGSDGIHSLWIEAGGTLFANLLMEQLVQRAFIYIAPQWMPRGKSAFPDNFSFELAHVVNTEWLPMGNDAVCQMTFLHGTPLASN